ncbi:hypothetical protein [Candidatus Electrothrix sp.]|uniref:hypothetical protein n=1 Tax=Candidatus Electrothrix sp. TaxID=2170559 RepID=UPI004055DFE7
MIHSISEEEYRSKLIALAYACPLDQDHPDCPLKTIRKRGFTGKMKWIDSLSLPTKKTLYKYHLLCYAKHKKKEEAGVAVD